MEKLIQEEMVAWYNMIVEWYSNQLSYLECGAIKLIFNNYLMKLGIHDIEKISDICPTNTYLNVIIHLDCKGVGKPYKNTEQWQA